MDGCMCVCRMVANGHVCVCMYVCVSDGSQRTRVEPNEVPFGASKDTKDIVGIYSSLFCSKRGLLYSKTGPFYGKTLLSPPSLSRLIFAHLIASRQKASPALSPSLLPSVRPSVRPSLPPSRLIFAHLIASSAMRVVYARTWPRIISSKPASDSSPSALSSALPARPLLLLLRLPAGPSLLLLRLSHLLLQSLFLLLVISCITKSQTIALLNTPRWSEKPIATSLEG